MAQGAPTATQATVAAYTAGGVMSVTNTLSYSGQLWSLLWRPHLPNAWVVTSVSGTGNPELEAGDIVWTGTLPASPIQMIYWVQVPAGARGSYSVRGEVEYQLSGMVNPANLYASPDPLSISNSPMVLTVTGLSAVNKVYDRTTVATLTGAATLSGVVPGDVVNLGGTATGSFADKTVGTNKLVTVSGLALTGADAGNYTPSLPSLSANITTTTANVTGLTVVSKVYDATTVATLTGTASLAGVVPGDVVNLSGTATGSFADQTVGTNKTVTVSGLALTGADAGNYRLSVPTLTANITPAPLTVTGITAASKPYDGTTSATIDTVNAILNGVLPADSENVTLVTSGVTGAFADKNVGTGELVTISGLTLGGTAAGNYALTQPTTTADIIPIPPPIVASPTLVGQTFGVSVTTVTGLNYTLEYKNAFTDTAWTAVQTLPGTGGTITLTDRTATNAMRFYRLVTQ